MDDLRNKKDKMNFLQYNFENNPIEDIATLNPELHYYSSFHHKEISHLTFGRKVLLPCPKPLTMLLNH